jgi:hypothetical protein
MGSRVENGQACLQLLRPWGGLQQGADCTRAVTRMLPKPFALTVKHSAPKTVATLAAHPVFTVRRKCLDRALQLRKHQGFPHDPLQHRVRLAAGAAIASSKRKGFA